MQEKRNNKSKLIELAIIRYLEYNSYSIVKRKRLIMHSKFSYIYNNNDYDINDTTISIDNNYSAESLVSQNKMLNWTFKRSVIVLTVMSIFLSALLTTGCNKNSSDNKSSKLSSMSLSSVITITPSPSPTPLQINESEVVRNYFGPLPTVSNPKTITHNELRALYVGSKTYGTYLDENIDIANKSAINALVVDVKESNGVYFKSENPLSNEIGAITSQTTYKELIRKAKENNIKVIARIVCFKDHRLAEKRPDLCIKDKNGNVLKYPLEGKKPFVNPYNKDVWKYNIDLAVEAIKLGFDEIQFDYVRFPTCSSALRATEYFGPEGTIPTKIEVINRFLQTARIKIQDELGIPLSADIFGIVLTSKLDGRLIGQDWESLGSLGLDTLSPMIYPSHYANGTVMGKIKFADPDKETYKFLNTVFNVEKFSEKPGFSHVRSYIQAYDYTQTQIFGQIQALSEHGFKEYIYWNAKGSYDITNMKKD